jgi:hypothetical protein
MAAKFFTGLPLDGPDPECVRGHGQTALAAVAAGNAPKPSRDHSHRTAKAGSARLTPRERPSQGAAKAGSARLTPRERPSQGAGPVPVSIGRRRPPERACDSSPLAGLVPTGR